MIAQSPPSRSNPATLRRRLLHRIGRRYQTITRVVRFGPLSLDFTRIANPNLVLDEAVAEEDRREKLTGLRVADPLHLPYWAELWDSAAGLGSFVARMDLPANSRVLDLGCGMGLAGAVAAARGADVCLADLESPALLFARLNCLPFDRNIRTRRLNWRTDHLGERFDLILGSDIVYEKQQWEFLDAFWREHLATGGCVLLGEPGRQSGELFGPWIRDRGWHLFESWEPGATPQDKPTRIFRLQFGEVSTAGV